MLRILLTCLLAMPFSFSASAQSEPATKLATLNDSLISYQTYYAEANMKDPGNTGAARLKLALGKVTELVDSYSKGEDVKKKMFAALKKLVTETKRYKTDRAKRLQEICADIAALEKALPAKLNPDDTKPEEAATTESTPDEYTDQPAATTPASETTTEPLSLDDADTAASDPVPATERPSLSGGSGYYLFGFSLVLILLLGAYLIWQQRRTAQVLFDRLTDVEVHAGFPRGEAGAVSALTTQRLEQVEQNTTRFMQQLETRLSGVEKQIFSLRADQSEMGTRHYGMANIEARLADVERSIGILPEGDDLPITDSPLVTMLPLTNGSTNGNGNHTHPDAPLVAAAVLEMPKLDLMPAIKALSELQLTTHISRVQQLCGAILPAIKSAKDTASRPSVDEAAFAELLQLAYVSSYNEGHAGLYQDLRKLAEQLDFIIEDELAGRMAFSDHYAENITFEAFFSSHTGQESDTPHLLEQKEILFQNINETAILKNTVLRVLRPAVLLLKTGAKTIIRKGLYLVKA